MTGVELRAAAESDAAAIAAVYRPYVTDSVVSFEAEPPDAEVVRARMLKAPRLPWFVATRDGAVVGFCYASHHHERAAYRWAVDCSVYLLEDERGRGTGRSLYVRLLAEVRALGYMTAFAGIALPNEASVGLHEALGFRCLGVYRDVGFKHGRWHDVGWWRLALRDPPAEPQEPKQWSP